ncbi:MAG: hypoxanthine phosphoribosyltransferase [Bacteroidota bacterium]
MGQIQLHDKKFRSYIDKEGIHERIEVIAKQISHDYGDMKPLFICILNGSFIFAADLFRAITIDAEISFIKLASYKGTSSTGSVVTSIGLDTDIHERHVIIVEDIIDTGKTLSTFLPEILHRQPASLKIASFLTKPDALQHYVKADYLCYEIPDKFVVGYGLDYDGLGRNLPDLYILVE